jgi:3-carboxy-cis,cis-muconate cycloisomerase
MAWSKKIRSNAAAFADTHMRESHDIVGFYMEDLIIPETCMMVGGMLAHAKHIFQNLTVKADAMRRNLEQSGGLIMTEALMIALTAKTGQKQTAHHLIHLAAMESFETGISFDQCLMKHPEISKHFTKEELKKALDPANYLGLSERCIDEVMKF